MIFEKISFSPRARSTLSWHPYFCNVFSNLNRCLGEALGPPEAAPGSPEAASGPLEGGRRSLSGGSEAVKMF